MSNGRLAVAALTANVNNLIYTVIDNCLYAEINLQLVNTNTVDATLEVALSTTSTPNTEDYIEKGITILADGGTINVNGLILSPGEMIIVKVNQTGINARVSGKTKSN